MAIVFPNSASITLRLVTGSALSYEQMDTNWSNLQITDQNIINVIEGAAYLTESNTFSQPQTFQSNVTVDGNLIGSMGEFTGPIYSKYPGVGFSGTASWAVNVVNGGGGSGSTTDVSTYLSSSWTASYNTGSFSGSFIGKSTGSFFGNLNGTASYATNANNVLVNNSINVNKNYSVAFVDPNDTPAPNTYGYAGLYLDSGLDNSGIHYNPSSNTLSASYFAGDLVGTASWAVTASNVPTASWANYSLNYNPMVEFNPVSVGAQFPSYYFLNEVAPMNLIDFTPAVQDSKVITFASAFSSSLDYSKITVNPLGINLYFPTGQTVTTPTLLSTLVPISKKSFQMVWVNQPNGPTYPNPGWYYVDGEFSVSAATTPSLQAVTTVGNHTSASMFITGSLGLTGSLNVSQTTIIGLGDYPNDAIAAAAGVPLNGIYRNGNTLSIRII